MRLLALLLPLVVLCSCDAVLSGAPGSAHISDTPPPTPDGGPSSTGPVLIEAHRFRYNESYDWNFRLEGVNLNESVPISFRTYDAGRDESSRITMTPRPTGEYAFVSSWDGYDHPNAWVYPVTLDPGPEGSFSVGDRFAALGHGDNSANTSTPAKSYHNTPRGVVIDYVDTDDGLAPQPTSVSTPEGTVIEDVAYLVYVPKGDKLGGSWLGDLSVEVYGPQGTRVVTESIGDGELPREVQELLYTSE